MYECGKLKKVIGNKILFQVSLELCSVVFILIDLIEETFQTQSVPFTRVVLFLKTGNENQILCERFKICPH